MALLGIPSLPKGTAIETQDVMLRGEEGIKEVVIREPTFQVGKRLICNGGPY